MLGFPIHYCKGMRPMMFQLSGFWYTLTGVISIVTARITLVTKSHDPLRRV